MKKLYKVFEDYGRMGFIDGIFIADERDVEELKGKELYLDEALGKHSEIYLTVNDENLEVLSEDQDFIDKIFDVFKTTSLSGYNPVDYYYPEDYEDEEE